MKKLILALLLILIPTFCLAQPPAPKEVSNEAYNATTWNGIKNKAPSKDAVRDALEALPASHDAITLSTDADAILSLVAQLIGVDNQTANTVLAGPATGAADAPTFRSLVPADIPDISSTYATVESINTEAELESVSNTQIATEAEAQGYVTTHEADITAVHGFSIQADCSGITSGFCLDSDDGILYSWDGDSVEVVAVISADAVAAAISAGAYTDDSVNAADINWADITNLGEGGLPNDFALEGDADAGDNDIHSIDGLYGFDDAVYIDMGADGILQAIADTRIEIQSPDIRFQVDALAYLKIVTTDGGITTISQQSDGTDGITIGDNDDNIIISGNNIDVDTTGNMTLGGTLTVPASATPTATFNDSDGAGAEASDKYAGSILMNMTDTTEDVEISDINIMAQISGVDSLVVEWDGSDESLTVGDSVSGEDLKWDFETATDNQVQVSSNSGATNIDFSALNLSTTGLITGGVKSVVDADGGEVDAYCYGGVWFASGTGTLLLPAVAAGMQITVENHTADDVLIDPDGTEVLRLNGTALGAGVAITGTDLGDGCVLTYYSAGVWSAFCSGYE